MFQLRCVSQAALILCVSTLATPGFTQTQTSPDTPELKRVEVTGSRIKRVDTETASPVQVITREQIERSGATTVTDVLKSVPANNAGSFDESATASFTPGAGGVSLRGLGAQATLVLINGRRVAPFGFASGGQSTFVDVNSIPLEVVERIETLLDGASAVYGSDAIAGVINIILRKDFAGFAASATYGQTSYRDANTPFIALTFGKGSLATDGYNFFGNISHESRSAVKDNARPATQTGDFRRFGVRDQRSDYSLPGNLFTVGGPSGSGDVFLAPVAGCAPLVDATAANNGRCVYDPTAYTDLYPKTSRDAIFVAGTVDLGGGTEFFTDVSLVRTKFSQQSASYGSNIYGQDYAGDIPTNAIVLHPGHPNNPYPTDVALRYRFGDVPFVTDVQSDTKRLVFGVRGSWMGWDAESGVLLSRSNSVIAQSGVLQDSVLVNEVLAPDGSALNSFIFGNPAANNQSLIGRLYPTLLSTGTTSTTSIDVKGSRDLMKLAGGSMGIAVGAEIREESFVSAPDPLVSANAISVLGGSSADGKRTISALYAEFSAPVTKSIEASLAARIDHYSDFGNATTPKAAIKWKALANLAFRATYSEGFRAPALTETSTSPSKGFYNNITDPVLCPVFDAANLNCNLSLPAISGANPALKPERSKSFTYGFVFEPTDTVSVTVDTYNIKRTDQISGLDPNYLLANESSYPGQVVRDPTTRAITQLNLPYTNLGSTHVQGYDVELKSRFNLGEYGKLTAEGSFNSEPTYLVAAVAGAPESNWAGYYTQPIHRWKLGFSWDVGPWSTSLTYNRTDGYLRQYTPEDTPCPYASGAHPELCQIDPWGTFDAFVGYKGFKNLDLGVNIQNVSNVEAPISERAFNYLTSFDSNYHNQLGRIITLRAKYTFW